MKCRLSVRSLCVVNDDHDDDGIDVVSILLPSVLSGGLSCLNAGLFHKRQLHK